MKDIFDIQNPWRNPGYKFPRERYIKRNAFRQLLKDLDNKEITVVIGSRQVGKTFLLRKLIKELLAKRNVHPQQIFYFNFDSVGLIDFIGNDRDFLDFVKNYGLPEKKSFIFLDEAQRVPKVSLLLKRYYDLDLGMKFVVAGSSSLDIKAPVKETLTGRKHLFELYPLTYTEFLRYKGLAISRDLEKAGRFEAEQYQRLMEEFILFGGYPSVVKEDRHNNKIRILKEIYKSYVYRDIGHFLKVKDIAGFDRLIKFLAARIGGLWKRNEAANNTRISWYFVGKYIFALEETYVLASLRPYVVNLRRPVLKMPKYFFCDPGMRNAMVDQFEPLEKRDDSEALVENFVFSEMIKVIDRDRLWFYRSLTGAQIDFLFVEGNRVIPMKVKYSTRRQRYAPRVFDPLDKYRGLKKGIIISKDRLGEEKRGSMRLIFRPAWSVYRLTTELNP